MSKPFVDLKPLIDADAAEAAARAAADEATQTALDAKANEGVDQGGTVEFASRLMDSANPGQESFGITDDTVFLYGHRIIGTVPLSEQQQHLARQANFRNAIGAASETALDEKANLVYGANDIGNNDAVARALELRSQEDPEVPALSFLSNDEGWRVIAPDNFRETIGAPENNLQDGYPGAAKYAKQLWDGPNNSPALEIADGNVDFGPYAEETGVKANFRNAIGAASETATQTALDGKADSSHTHTGFSELTVYQKLIVAPSSEPSPAEQQAKLWAPYAAFNELDINGTAIYPDDLGTVISGTPVTISCPLAFSNPSAVRAALGAASATALDEKAVPNRFMAVAANWLTTDTVRYFSNFADLSWRDNINAAHWLVTKPSTIKRVLYYFSSEGTTAATAHTGATLNLYPKAGGSAIPLISGINLVGLAVSGAVHTFDSGPLNIAIPAAAFAVGIQTGTTTNVPTACRHTIEIFTT
jgi:hypothetical protein